MCLAVPGKVTELFRNSQMLMGKVDFGGVIREVCFAALPEIQIGDYVIVHAGFALNILSEQEARETLETFKQLEAFENDTPAQNPSRSQD